jgi:flagellar basal-body rod protein FlgG
MGIRALNSAASGMDSMQTRLDVIANNLANAQTTAFKRSRVNFEDLFYQRVKIPGQEDSGGRRTAVGLEIGLGARVQSTQLDQQQGSLLDTGSQLDMAIVGDGYFQVDDGQQTLYTRAGNFSINANGEVVLSSADRGRLILPALQIPPDALGISVSADGIVSVMQPGSPNPNPVGNIELVRFGNPQGLLQKGENLFAESGASGSPLAATPGQDGMGTIRQAFLESSNVEPVRELVDLITTQRTFELNSQVVQVADQALQLVANLRRF